MSIIRFSHVKETLTAPDAAGNLVEGGYTLRRRRGALGSFARPGIDVEVPGEADRTRMANAVAHPLLARHIEAEIAAKAARLAPGAPVLAMVHGFLFDPRMQVSSVPAETDNPHGRLYHFLDTGEASEIRHHTTGWPRQMGIAEDDAGESGLAVGFGWLSQPGFASSLISHFQNFYARAYDNGREAAWSLLAVLDALARTVTDRPVDLLCHSLGSAVVVRAIAIAAKYHLPLVPRLGRIIILGGSEYTGEANLMYRRLMAMEAEGRLDLGAGPVFYNVVSRENDVLDKLAENFGPRSFFTNTQVIGHNGLEAARRQPRWVDLQIDGGPLRAWMIANRNIPVSGDQPGNPWDHWYYYTYRDNMTLYRRIIRDRPAFSLERLRAEAIPEGVAVGAFSGD
jgi:hypothetical protein